MKVLCISHVPWDSIYGAGTSLRNHWGVLTPLMESGDIKADLVTRVGLIEWGKSIPYKWAIKPPFRTTRRMVFCLDQNNERDVFGWRQKTRTLISRMFNNLAEKISILLLKRFLAAERFDILHFNSHVLASVARKLVAENGRQKPTVIVHVRDFLIRNPTNQERDNLLAIDSFICIDAATRDRLIEVLGDGIKLRCTIIQNPFYSVTGRHFEAERFSPNRDLVKFAVVGPVTPDKGVIAIARAFLSSNIPKAILYVVGAGSDSKSVEEIANISAGRLIVLGEIRELVERGFFNSIDVLVRGECAFRTGRTVYEALYAGVAVLLPGNQQQMNADANLRVFQSSVYLYPPDQFVELAISMNKIASTISPETKLNRHLSDNLKAYSTSIMKVYHYNGSAQC